MGEESVTARILRRRHASGSGNNADNVEPTRKRMARASSSGEDRSAGSISGENVERSRQSTDDESVPSNLSTPRMSPRSRSPVKVSGGESVVVTYPRKRRRKI